MIIKKNFIVWTTFYETSTISLDNVISAYVWSTGKRAYWKFIKPCKKCTLKVSYLLILFVQCPSSPLLLTEYIQTKWSACLSGLISVVKNVEEEGHVWTSVSLIRIVLEKPIVFGTFWPTFKFLAVTYQGH